MISNFIDTIRGDATIVSRWVRGQALEQAGENNQNQQIRVAIAALRILAVIGMVFSTLWTLSILVFIVSVPVKLVLQLALGVTAFALCHDVFVSSQNASRWMQHRTEQEIRLGTLSLNDASQLTEGTFLRLILVWLSTRQNLIRA